MRHVQQRGHLDEVRSNSVCFVLRRQTRTQAKKHACAHVSLAGTPAVCWSTQLFSGVLDLERNVLRCWFRQQCELLSGIASAHTMSQKSLRQVTQCMPAGHLAKHT